MRAAIALALIAVVALVGCKKKSQESGSSGSAAAGSARTGSAGEGPALADVLIKVARKARPGLEITRMQINYVRSDGTMDPTYGVLEASLVGPEPAPPPDDPSRPTGAPITNVPRRDRDCADQTWRATTGWVVPHAGMSPMCLSFGAPRPVRCTVVEVWQRAIAEGAPANALAKIDLMNGLPEETRGLWQFSIDDAPRNVHFTGSYEDDCAPRVEAP